MYALSTNRAAPAVPAAAPAAATGALNGDGAAGAGSAGAPFGTAAVCCCAAAAAASAPLLLLACRPRLLLLAITTPTARAKLREPAERSMAPAGGRCLASATAAPILRKSLMTWVSKGGNKTMQLG